MSDKAWACVVTFLLGMATGIFIGSVLGKASQRQLAVDSGAGYWRCDPTTGEAVFTFKEPNK